MKYEIVSSEEFDHWLKRLDSSNTNRVLARLYRLEDGNFGDYKKIDSSIYELRLFFGKGYRIYYTIEKNQIVILLCGGDKSTQVKDIKKAQAILKRRE
jgi:putative addiction module killer protein